MPVAFPRNPPPVSGARLSAVAARLAALRAARERRDRERGPGEN